MLRIIVRKVHLTDEMEAWNIVLKQGEREITLALPVEWNFHQTFWVAHDIWMALPARETWGTEIEVEE
jgi:hypothetical protein